MLFAIAMGSSGNGAERFSVHLPFVLSSDVEIETGGDTWVRKVNGRTFELKRFEDCYALRVGTFPSKTEAEQFFSKLRAALLWTALRKHSGLRCPTNLKGLQVFDPPVRIAENSPIAKFAKKRGWSNLDGAYDANRAFLIPEHQRLIRSEMGVPRVVKRDTEESFTTPILEALEFPNVENVVHDERLRLAIEVYLSSFFEVSARSRFLQLVTTLEVLAPTGQVPEAARRLVGHLKNEAKLARDAAPEQSTERLAMEALVSRVGNLAEQSIGQSIAQFVTSVLERFPDAGFPEHLVAKVKDVYGVRSRLIHDGHVDEVDLKRCEWLGGFLTNALQRLFRSCSRA